MKISFFERVEENKQEEVVIKDVSTCISSLRNDNKVNVNGEDYQYVGLQLSRDQLAVYLAKND
ncbi:hypothetical protein [Aneurinibacillus tyrosinisolvens]|jgi:hypothetical protein|uniref:hypothetical protein n=1 Tax=Aneurinibacillus tyrosinisolvens TaxID=1443435 RepID=UPI00063FBC0A|nr:hypothetical protein [Aneurinibacillus tyrosinisolvens]